MNLLEMFNSLNNIEKSKDITELLKLNKHLKKQNLFLKEWDVKDIIETRNITLKAQGRLELNMNILKDIIRELAYSPYVNQHNLVENINDIYEIFHYIKNHTSDFLEDEEIFKAIMFLFNKVYNGSTELMKGKGIERIVNNFRSGRELTDMEDEEGDEY
ncbi:DUF6323 family protein [Clostridium sp. BJN0013]|uniref:DUF6323 family protein n=1 Tax=Clostridium sp. BJN0013 TaxID=3236840 RepID=UPI0034C6B4D7